MFTKHFRMFQELHICLECSHNAENISECSKNFKKSSFQNVPNISNSSHYSKQVEYFIMLRFLNTSVLENFSKHFKMLQTIQNVSNISTLFQIFKNPNSKPSRKVPNVLKMLLTIQNVPNMFLAITKCLEHFIMFQNRRRRNRKESSKRKSRHAKYRPSA